VAAGASRQVQRLQWGSAMALLLGLLALLIWGPVAARAAAIMGGVATAMQLLAAWRMARTGKPAELDNLRVYLLGVGLRFVGVGVLALLAMRWPDFFPPLPSAMGYLGTVLMLLYLETRRTR